ncbi:MAG: ribosome recycling factor, partial [Chitinivibrionales bacterium]
FAAVRTGRASPSLLEGITIEYYGAQMPINQVANISIPEARQLTIQPWDKTMLEPVEKAILASNLGITPQNDGNLIRLTIPALTKERREQLSKQCRQIAENNKIAIRNIRRDTNDTLKKEEKAKNISEDDLQAGLDRVQEMTDKNISKIDELYSDKENEIMND